MGDINDSLPGMGREVDLLVQRHTLEITLNIQLHYGAKAQFRPDDATAGN